MRPLEALVDVANSAWPAVRAQLAASPSSRVLPATSERAEKALIALQITTRSPLGAVAYESAGTTLLSGWVRLLGAGDADISGLCEWNGLGSTQPQRHEGLLVVAHDAVGGVFALDGGRLGAGRGDAFYFAPDSLRWEPVGAGYSALLGLPTSNRLDEFYASLRWSGWQLETSTLGFDEAFSLYPPPWSAEGRDLSRVSRRRVPAMTLFAQELETARQLAGG